MKSQDDSLPVGWSIKRIGIFRYAVLNQRGYIVAEGGTAAAALNAARQVSRRQRTEDPEPPPLLDWSGGKGRGE